MRSELNSKLIRRIWQLRRWNVDAMLGEQEKLYYGQFPILMYIIQHPGCKQKDIADEFVLSRASVTKSIQRMLKNELVTRTINQDDERQVQLYITERGEKLVSSWQDALVGVENKSFKGFSNEEIDKLNEFLRRMADNLETDYTRNKSSKELARIQEGKEKKQ